MGRVEVTCCDWCGDTESDKEGTDWTGWFSLKEEGEKHDLYSEKCADKMEEFESRKEETPSIPRKAKALAYP